MMYVIEKISVPIKCSRLLIEMMKKDLQQRIDCFKNLHIKQCD